MMKTLFFAIVLALVFLISFGYCQDTRDLIGQVTQVYGGQEAAGGNFIAGFSLAGLIGGIVFGCVGFVAFIYGKRNTQMKPLIVGLLLMGYPYFVKNTVVLYVVGVVLTMVLFWG